MTSQYEVFICYETTSEFDLAVNVRDSLRKIDIRAFVAQMDIPEGVEWKFYINDAIEKCKHFVAIISNVALFSEDVKREVNLAKELAKIIIPKVQSQ